MPQVEIPLMQNFGFDVFAGAGHNSITSVSSYIKNGWVMPQSGSGGISIQKRRGFEEIYSDVDHTIGYGVYHWKDNSVDSILWIAFDNNLTGKYLGRMNGSNFTNISTIPATPTGTIAWVQTNAPAILVHTGSTTEPVYHLTSGFVATRLTNATHGFPSGSMAAGIAELDQFIFVARQDGRIYNSNVGAPLAWTSTDFTTAVREADVTNYICKHADHLCVIGTRSVEFFYNANNPAGSPLARREDVYYPVGSLGTGNTNLAKTADSDDNYVAFAGTDHAGLAGIYLIDNLQLERISPDDMDIFDAGLNISVRLMTYYGRTYVMVNGNFDLVNTLVYDIKYKVWYLWNSVTLDTKIHMGGYDGDLGISITNGNIYQMVQTDVDGDQSGTPDAYDFEIVTEELDFGSWNDKIIWSLTLFGENATNNTVEVSYSDDGGTTYSTARSIDAESWNTLRRLGRTKKRKFKFTHSDEDIITLHKCYVNITPSVYGIDISS